MTHEYRDADTYRHLSLRISCEDCDWQNRRDTRWSADASKASHKRRHPSHSVTIEETEPLFDRDDEQEEDS